MTDRKKHGIFSLVKLNEGGAGMKNNYDYSKLRGLIVEKYRTLSNLAKKIGRSPAWLSAKLLNVGDFNQTDMDTIMDLLDIDRKNIDMYFFTHKV